MYSVKKLLAPNYATTSQYDILYQIGSNEIFDHFKKYRLVFYCFLRSIINLLIPYFDMIQFRSY